MNLKIELEAREEKKDNGTGIKNTFFIGRLHAPITINCNNTAFLIFVSEEGIEELQIANLDNDFNLSNCWFDKNNTARGSTLKIDLAKKSDGNGAIMYFAKIKWNGTIYCETGTSFMIFNSKPGKEQLQITGKIIQHGEKYIKQAPVTIERYDAKVKLSSNY